MDLTPPCQNVCILVTSDIKFSETSVLICKILNCSLPAQVRTEDVQSLLLGQQGVEGTAICTVDHVTLLRCPQTQFAETQNVFLNVT